MDATNDWLTKFREWVARQEKAGVSRPNIARQLRYSRPHVLNILAGTDTAAPSFRRRVEEVAGIPAEIEEAEAPHAA